MDTERVYDIPTPVAIITIVLAIISFFVAAAYPNVALAQSEIVGAWGVFLLTLGFTVYVVHGWIYGRKVEVPAWASN